jgi:hypothetical protein
LLSKKKNLMMIGYGPRDGRSRWLEYAKASPPRTPLASMSRALSSGILASERESLFQSSIQSFRWRTFGFPPSRAYSTVQWRCPFWPPSFLLKPTVGLSRLDDNARTPNRLFHFTYSKL